MKRELIGMLVPALTSVMLLFAAAEPAGAQGCPANSSPVSQRDEGDVIRVTCRCNAGFAKVDNACKPVNEARAILATRHRDAMRGLEASLSSLGNELNAQNYASLRKAVVVAAPLLATAAATRDMRNIAKASGAALIAVAAIAYEGGEQWKSCSFPNEDARTACRNANNFRQIAETSLKQFEATFR